MIYEYIDRLVDYGLKTELITPDDVIYARNSLLDTLKLSDYIHEDFSGEMPLEEILKNLLDCACEQQLIGDNITERDLFDTRLMACLTPRPSEVISKFRSLYDDSPKRATDWFYKFSRDTDYIRRYRIAKDMKWKTSTKYGEIDITINLSKPEKDPKAIAAAKNAKASGYPKCLLCPENVGYAGRLNHPARNNHRIIPLTINGTQWGLQYSPYVYYNEHCILFNCEHTPMVIDRSAFRKLFDFIGQFPHYFIGSNADLPIVGGSILSHEHFQGGCYEFPLERAEIEKTYTIQGFEDVEVGRVKWAMSVIRIRSENSDRLVELADKILTAWRGYTDEEAFIFAETDGEPHNTITPIARMKNGKYELDLVLRNNITTDEHPLGVYHPHADLHHIKKENIGLIEVMGLAVLPARLK
ncbi:MAG: UDP-glucose--hexose-1-phosphate uridylyltransferase, partial [Oscillospiraceae bacterium]|nr:UDP-glucose--hexose-1-phosphate uridylyltransferase [Oscillospiraceae bacterium]